MLRATFSSRKKDAEEKTTVPTTPSWFLNTLTPWLQSLSRWACTHPIYTILFVAIMASTSYIGVLESDLLEPPASSSTAAGQVDYSTILSGSKALHAGQSNGWKWQNSEADVEAAKVIGQ